MEARSLANCGGGVPVRSRPPRLGLLDRDRRSGRARGRAGPAGWPAGAPPVRAVLISDIHVAARHAADAVARIVAQINALGPTSC